jgi:hypothetical protein
MKNRKMKKMLLLIFLLSCKTQQYNPGALKTEIDSRYNVKKRTKQDDEYQSDYYNSRQFKNLKKKPKQ